MPYIRPSYYEGAIGYFEGWRIPLDTKDDAKRRLRFWYFNFTCQLFQMLVLNTFMYMDGEKLFTEILNILYGFCC